jgi:hypothetical protein
MNEAQVRESRNLLHSAAQHLVIGNRELTGRIFNFLNATAEDNTGLRGTISEAGSKC